MLTHSLPSFYSTVNKSSLLKGTDFLKRHEDSGFDGSDCDVQPSSEGQLFRDYLKQQIDHLMTGDAGRDGVAEGRRGTHVEVLPSSPDPQHTLVLEGRRGTRAEVLPSSPNPHHTLVLEGRRGTHFEVSPFP